jgi:hypothetical protein
MKVTLKVQERDDTAPSYHVAPITESGGEAWDEIDIKHGYLWVVCSRVVDGVTTTRIFPARVVDSISVIES